ncbi:hypothetical protein [Labedaea rhizosphaerae]|uniref:Uncharacterized protein n=1 Tax=Labedaea rhizosphaerae TaxID=598644 RepID=A0A4R6S3C3_LABRH|nr:hypothetical protein [Labedaea rhizosphaerae]TDP94101.1 hypothetical protein EV186_106495 [Labedaea rhizosphaerae]
MLVALIAQRTVLNARFAWHAGWPSTPGARNPRPAAPSPAKIAPPK